MKTRITAVMLAALAAFLFITCKGPVAPQNEGRMTIKGNFNGGTHGRGFSAMDFLAALLGRGQLYGLDPLQVAKVATFQGHNGYMISNVVNGSFQIDTQAGKPTGMIFIGATNNFLGYLNLNNGIESIPLNMASSGVNTIDLQTLSSSGGIVDPGHNPIGSEIPMTSGDIIAYAFGNGPYASVIKSPDVDSDGIVDITTGCFFRYYISYDVKAGSFVGAGLTPVLSSPVEINCFRLGIKITDPDSTFPQNITINGPAGSGLEGVQNDLRFPSPDGSMCGYYSAAIFSPPIPPAGVYVIPYESKTLTYNVPSQSDITKFLAIPVPTFLLNGDGTINKILLEYKISDGSATIDPKTLVSDIGIQIDVLPASGQFYSVYNLPAGTTEHTLTNQSIIWSAVTGVRTGYNDVFGNAMGVTWSRP
jgi:hypothetical protein